jgi:RNA polymerase sigma-70 factor, ECF subfamily
MSDFAISAESDLNWSEDHFCRLFSQHRERLRQMVSFRMDRRLAARVDPSDVIQETFLEGLRRLPEYVRNLPFGFYPWLRQLAEQKLIDCHRIHNASCRDVTREQKLECVDNSSAHVVGMLAASLSSPLQTLVRIELRDQLLEALGELSNSDRDILVLYHLEQLSVAEISDVLGLTEAAVRSRRRRALERVSQLLTRFSDDTP